MNPDLSASFAGARLSVFISSPGDVAEEPRFTVHSPSIFET
jgi:hypothetical protein